MSVDNYIQNVSALISRRIATALEKPMPKLFYFQKDDTEHWVQSEYARQFVLLNGVPAEKVYVVEDYLNQAFWLNADKVNLSEKKDIVAFNPKKGFEITKKLIEFGQDINWVPIENMTPAQVQALLELSKVYVDFGNHPGKDRIPREAALSGCVVIVGKRGAAMNDVDINIPAEFKFGKEQVLGEIIEKIRDVFKNFDENYLKQEDYRQRILDDKPRFAAEVAAALEITPPEIDFLAIAQGLSENGAILLEKLCAQNVIPTFIVDDTFANLRDFEENGVIKTINNTNYFLPPNLPGYGVMIISTADAKFLYNEGRISKFVIFNPSEEEIDFIAETFEPAQGDLLEFS